MTHPQKFWLIYKVCKLIEKYFCVFFSYSIRISGKSINFDDEQINKSNFHQNKTPFIIDDINVNKMLTSNKEPYGKKLHLNTLFDMMIMTTLDHYV